MAPSSFAGAVFSAACQPYDTNRSFSSPMLSIAPYKLLYSLTKYETHRQLSPTNFLCKMIVQFTHKTISVRVLFEDYLGRWELKTLRDSGSCDEPSARAP